MARNARNPDPKCPAAEIVHPAFSRNPADARCRVQGGLQPAKGSPCCNEYTQCGIWKYHIEIERGGPSTKKMRDATRSQLHTGVLN